MPKDSFGLPIAAHAIIRENLPVKTEFVTRDTQIHCKWCPNRISNSQQMAQTAADWDAIRTAPQARGTLTVHSQLSHETEVQRNGSQRVRSNEQCEASFSKTRIVRRGTPACDGKPPLEIESLSFPPLSSSPHPTHKQSTLHRRTTFYTVAPHNKTSRVRMVHFYGPAGSQLRQGRSAQSRPPSTLFSKQTYRHKVVLVEDYTFDPISPKRLKGF